MDFYINLYSQVTFMCVHCSCKKALIFPLCFCITTVSLIWSYTVVYKNGITFIFIFIQQYIDTVMIGNITFLARDSILYYRPSICPSVTRVDQSKMVEVRNMQPSPQSSPMTLVSWRLT